MKLGLLVEAEEGLTWARWRRLARAADDLGFESLWISDHFCSPWDDQRHGLDAWMALAVAAADTRRARLGTLVSPVTFRPAAVVARMAESLDSLSEGRLTVGLGLGWNADEHAAFGVAFPPLAERAGLLEQGIARMRQMLGQRHVPLLIGGGGRRALELAARAADEWNLTTNDVRVYQARAARLAAACASVGRDVSAIRASVAVGVLIGRDARDVRQRSRHIQGLVPPLAEVEVGDVPDAARARGWVAGTAAQIVAALAPFAAAGVDLAILGLYDLDDVVALELIAADVMPALA